MGSVFCPGQGTEALQELNRAVELDPQRIESYLSLARFYASMNDKDTADATYKRAISVNNNLSPGALRIRQVPGCKPVALTPRKVNSKLPSRSNQAIATRVSCSRASISSTSVTTS